MKICKFLTAVVLALSMIGQTCLPISAQDNNEDLVEETEDQEVEEEVEEPVTENMEESEDIVVENDSGTFGTNVNWYLDSNNVLYINGNGDIDLTSSTEYFIYSVKSVVIGNGITNVPAKMFNDCFTLQSVSLSNTVKSIGERAFEKCSNLETINLPNSLVSIGRSAFKDCTKLKSLNIPSSVTDIGEGAFKGCSGLVDSNGFLIIQNRLFYYSGYSSTVTVPSGVTSIEKEAFSNTSITKVTLPSGIKKIGESAFAYSTLQNINIPNTVTEIGYAAFEYTSIKTISLPNSITKIDEYAFYSSKLTSITIPSSIKKIAAYAFDSCESLKNVSIPTSVEDIDNFAFADCVSLETITIPNSVKNIGINAFQGCTYLSSITLPNTLRIIQQGTFSFCKHLESITLPESLERIESEAFYNSGLKSIILPKNVGVVMENAFTSCQIETLTMYSGIKSIAQSAFDKYLQTIYYYGTGYDFYNIDFNGENNVLLDSSISVIYRGPSLILNSEEMDIKIGETNINFVIYVQDGQSSSVSGGITWSVNKSTGLQLTPLDINAGMQYGCKIKGTKAGTYVVTAKTNNGLEKSFSVYVHKTENDTFTSSNWPNNYNNSSTEVFEKTYSTADSILIRFDSDSYTEANYDKIKIMNQSGHVYYELSGGSFAGNEYEIDDNYVKIEFTSDGSVSEKGFSAQIIPQYGINKIRGYSCTLTPHQSIGLRFHVELTKEMKRSETAYAKITLPSGEIKQISVKEALQSEDGMIWEKGCLFMVSISAKDLNVPVKLQLFDNGVAKSEVFTYTLDQYFNYLIKNDVLNADVAKKVMTYGYYTQLYFDYKLDSLPTYHTVFDEPTNHDIYKLAPVYDKIGITNPKMYLYDNNPDVQYQGARIVLGSNTMMKFYFIGDATFKVDGEKVNTYKEGKFTVVQINFITSPYQSYSITTNNFVLKYSLNCYKVQALEKGKTSLFQLMCALTDYLDTLFDNHPFGAPEN